MPKKAKELSALQVARLTEPGFYAVGGVAGLHLQVTSPTARSWILRAKVAGKRPDIGHGGYPDVTVAAAREAARQDRAKIKVGIDPVAERRAARSALQASVAAAVTFEFAAKQYVEAHEAEWRNAKHGQQWRNTLETYAYPIIGAMLVRDVELPQVLAVLNPIWKTKTETAKRLRGRIESILDWATASGYRAGLNPARWKGHLSKLLGAPSKIAKVTHHAALPLPAVGAFVRDLRTHEGMGARALEFAILTAARSGEVRGARWQEIDVAEGHWTIPGARMKTGDAHRVPLSGAAIKLLRALPRMAGNDLLFPAPRGRQLSDMTLTQLMRRMNASAVPHGCRSSFREWAAERTNYPREVAEMALAHRVGDKTERAYWRGDVFDKRRRMMAEWATFCGKVETKNGAVIPMRSRA
jgi:integrase